MLSAGIEGGSKRAIEAEWSLDDVSMIRRHWLEHGPPLNIAVLAIAASLGMKIGAERGAMPLAPQELAAPGDLSILDLAARIPPPLPGGDTFEASQALARLLSPEGSS